MQKKKMDFVTFEFSGQELRISEVPIISEVFFDLLYNIIPTARRVKKALRF